MLAEVIRTADFRLLLGCRPILLSCGRRFLFSGYCSNQSLNSNHRHHPPCPATFFAMRKEKVGSARSAEIRHLNFCVVDAGPAELITGDGNKVKVQGRMRVRPVAWRLFGKEKQGIPSGDLRFHFIVGSGAKVILTFWVATAKCVHHFIAHFIATRPDGRPNRRQQIIRLRIKDANHFTDGDLHDARERSTPSGMDGGHGAAARVSQEDGHAVCPPYGKQNAGLLSDQGVTLVQRHARDLWRGIAGRPVFKLAARASHHLVNVSRVNLPEFGEREMRRAQFVKKPFSVFFHNFSFICFNETEIQSRGGRPAGASDARTESVPHPALGCQAGALNPFEAPARDYFSGCVSHDLI